MSETEKLTADVPAQDPHFVLAVMARIEHRHFHRELMRTGLLAGAVAALLALVVPQFDINWVGNLSPKYNITVAAILMIASIMWPRLSRSLA